MFSYICDPPLKVKEHLFYKEYTRNECSYSKVLNVSMGKIQEKKVGFIQVRRKNFEK